MPPMERPQRQRRVPSRFREIDSLSKATAAKAKASSGGLGRAPPQPAAPEAGLSKKRRVNPIRPPVAPPVQGAAVTSSPASVAPAPSPAAIIAPTTHAPASPPAEVSLLARLPPASEPAQQAADCGGQQTTGLVTECVREETAKMAALDNTHAASGQKSGQQREASSDSSDVQIIEYRPSAKKGSAKKKDRGAASAQNSLPAASARGIPPDSAAHPSSSSAPPAPGPLSAAHQESCTPAGQTREMQGMAASAVACPDLQPLPKASPRKADPKQGFATPTKPSAPSAAVDARPSGTDTQAAMPTGTPPQPKFLPLFRREATPPRPDFSDEDTDSDGDDLIAQRRRKQKAGAHSSRRASSVSKLCSLPDSSPDSRLTHPRAHPSSKTGDPDWLKLPSPEAGFEGPHTGGAESATLIRLRQRRAELLALARGASSAPERIQAQSAAEARALEKELEKEAAKKEAEANARAAAKVAASLARQEKQDAGEEDQEREVEGAAQSVIVKIRASDGSQERFKADPLEKLFKAYIKKVHPQGPLAGAAFRFKFDGDPVSEKQTPEELGLEDDDIIEVMQGR